VSKLEQNNQGDKSITSDFSQQTANLNTDKERSILLTISIVIIGDSSFIIPCLESIEAQTETPYELYLVTNQTSASLITRLQSLFPYIKIIQRQQRHSFAANHNQVLQQCQGDYVLLLNDDTVIINGALDKMLAYFTEGERQLGIVGCTNLDQHHNFTLSCYPFPSIKTIIWQHAALFRWFPGKLYERYLAQAKGDQPFVVDWVKGSCFLICSDVVRKIGFLDEQFFLFNEEVDYCYRAKTAGYSIYQVPEAQIIHYESTTTRRFVSIKLKGHYLGKLYFLAKHGFWRDLYFVRAWFSLELLAKSFIRAFGVMIGRPSDARERLNTYWNLLQICLTYRGQPAATLLHNKTKNS
jgi:hypothetical protein